MEYVFGTKGEAEVLKTKGDAHTNLSGYHEVVREYSNQTISDSFRIVRKLESSEDVEGNCYDWYEIDRHYRITDKTKTVMETVTETRTELEDAMCEQDAAVSERLDAIEDALCELDKN